jgi:hypothetical protein
MPRCECPFALADANGVARTPVVLQVVFDRGSTTMVLHVGCTGRRTDGSANLERLRMLGEKGIYNSLSTTRER